jgi:DNA-3-methyladenine glycosylase II
VIRTDADLAAALSDLLRVDPRLVPIGAATGPLPLRRVEAGFPGLAWIVTGQQISVSAATAIFARLQGELGGIDAASMLAADDAALRRAGLSLPKMRTLRALAAAACEGRLDFDALAGLPAEEAVAALVALPGIGPWTAESYLLFALGHRDVFPAADIALQEAARRAFDLPARPAAKQLGAMSEAWRPLRAVAARLLWAYYRIGRSAPTDLSRKT